MEDEFELGSLKRRKVKPIKTVHKETMLPNLVKSVIPDASSVVGHNKEEQEEAKITNTEEKSKTFFPICRIMCLV